MGFLTEFRQGFILGGFIFGIIGFGLAALMAMSGRGNVQEELDKFQDDVLNWHMRQCRKCKEGRG